LEVLEEPLLINGRRVQIGASIGIALAWEAATDPDVLLRRADAAMYAAKRTDGGNSRYADAQSFHRSL